MPPVWAPTDPMALIMATRISANITAYSTAVAASSPRHNVAKKCLIAAPHKKMPESAVGKGFGTARNENLARTAEMSNIALKAGDSRAYLATNGLEPSCNLTLLIGGHLGAFDVI